MRIGIDIDDTICSTTKELIKYQNKFLSEYNIYEDELWKYYKDVFLERNLEKIYNNAKIKDNAKEIINKSDVIYIVGGNPYIEMENIKSYNLIDTLREFNGIVIGISAGSMNMCNNVCYIDEENNIKEYEGIGLIDINIAPHLDFNNIDYLEEIFRVSKIRKTIDLPNESFIRIANKNIQIIGEHYIVENETINIS